MTNPVEDRRLNRRPNGRFPRISTQSSRFLINDLMRSGPDGVNHQPGVEYHHSLLGTNPSSASNNFARNAFQGGNWPAAGSPRNNISSYPKEDWTREPLAPFPASAWAHRRGDYPRPGRSPRRERGRVVLTVACLPREHHSYRGFATPNGVGHPKLAERGGRYLAGSLLSLKSGNGLGDLQVTPRKVTAQPRG